MFRNKTRNLLLSLVILFSQALAVNSTNVPLFNEFPNLKEKVGHVSLATLPTPVHKLEKLGTAIGASNLYIKRDDLSGIPFAGNKMRKLEFLFGDALKHEAIGVLTRGYAGSNFTCATAACAKQLGMPCTCLHIPQIPTAYLHRNLLLSLYNNAQLQLCSTSAEMDKVMMQKNKDFKEKTGRCLYFIPSGGSNDIGTIGFINAALELKNQIDQGLMPEPDYLYVTLGSCGTAAGLIIGAKIAGLKTVIVPICIEPDDTPNQHKKKLEGLIQKATALLHNYDETFPLMEKIPDEIVINHDFAGPKYAFITKEDHAAVKLLFDLEQIKIDGTYAGKTFAAMLHDITTKNLKEKVVLFWDTFCQGSFEKQIKTVDSKNLPEGYQRIFAMPLQPLDQGV